MKRLIIIILLAFCITTIANAQRNTVELNLSQQPSPLLHFRLLYDKATTSYNGQGYTFFCQNLTPGKSMRVQFDLVAYTICGTEVSEHMDFLLEANETVGGGGIMNSTYVGSVPSSNCKGEKIAYKFKGYNYTGINRIKTLGIKNLSINKRDGNTVASANANSNIKLSDSADAVNKTSTTSNNTKATTNTTITKQINAVNTQVYKNTPVNNTNPGVRQLQQTQNYINQQNQQTQQKAAVVSQGLHAIGDMIISANSASTQRAMASIDNFYDAKDAASKLSLKLSTEAYDDLTKGNYEAAIDKLYNAVYLHAEDAYNEFSLTNLYESKKYADEKPISADYFPKPKGDGMGYIRLELQNALPDLYYLPLCHCYTKPVYTRVYDDAFILLRSMEKCKSIYHYGKAYSVPYYKKTPDAINELAAVTALHKAIDAKKLDNVYDWIDYTNSYVWLGFLENKNAKTVNDLFNGLNTLVSFYQNIQLQLPYVKQFGQDDDKFLNSSYALINYFIADYYYRIAQNVKDAALIKKIAVNLRELELLETSIDLSLSKKYTNEHTQSVYTKFMDHAMKLQ